MKKTLVMFVLIIFVPTIILANIDSKDTLTIISTHYVNNIDPACLNKSDIEIAVVSNLYDRLGNIEYKNGKYVVEPSVADSWKYSDDGKIWTFHIRERKWFSNGSPLTVDDIVFSIKRTLKLNPNYWIFSNLLGIDENSVEKVNYTTIRIKLKKYVPPKIFLYVMSSYWFGIVSKDEVLKHEKNYDLGSEWLSKHSAGSGPYVFEAFGSEKTIGKKIILKYSVYQSKTPKIKRIVIKMYPDLNIAAEVFIRDKEADILWTNYLNNTYGKVERYSGVKILRLETPYIMYLAMNVDKKPFDDPKVRRAIRFSIDSKSIITVYSLSEQGEIHFIPEGFLENKYDVSKAKEILKESKYYKDIGEYKIKFICPRSSQIIVKIAYVIGSFVDELGIKIDIVSLHYEDYNTAFEKKNYGMILKTWQADIPCFSAFILQFSDYTHPSVAWNSNWKDDIMRCMAKLYASGYGKNIESDLIEYWKKKNPYVFFIYANNIAYKDRLKGIKEAFSAYYFNVEFEKIYK